MNSPAFVGMHDTDIDPVFGDAHFEARRTAIETYRRWCWRDFPPCAACEGASPIGRAVAEIGDDKMVDEVLARGIQAGDDQS